MLVKEYYCGPPEGPTFGRSVGRALNIPNKDPEKISISV
jgi:hypothetical protein